MIEKIFLDKILSSEDQLNFALCNPFAAACFRKNISEIGLNSWHGKKDTGYGPDLIVIDLMYHGEKSTSFPHYSGSQYSGYNGLEHRRHVKIKVNKDKEKSSRLPCAPESHLEDVKEMLLTNNAAPIVICNAFSQKQKK